MTAWILAFVVTPLALVVGAWLTVLKSRLDAEAYDKSIAKPDAGASTTSSQRLDANFASGAVLPSTLVDQGLADLLKDISIEVVGTSDEAYQSALKVYQNKAKGRFGNFGKIVMYEPDEKLGVGIVTQSRSVQHKPVKFKFNPKK